MTANRRPGSELRAPTSWRVALDDVHRRRDELEKMKASRLAVLQRAGAAIRSLRDSMAHVANDVEASPLETGVFPAVHRRDEGDD